MSEFEYTPAEKPKLNWAEIILAVWGALIIIAVFFFFIWKPLSDISGRTNDILNQSENDSQGVVVGEPNPNGENQTVPAGSGGQYNCDTDTYNCTDFQNQSEAQTVFDSCFKNYGDIHGLDLDGNGKACENLK